MWRGHQERHVSSTGSASEDGRAIGGESLGLKCGRMDLCAELEEIHKRGVTPKFRGETPSGPKVHGYPHNPRQSLNIVQKLRKDVMKGRMFLCSNNQFGNERILATPPTLVQKKHLCRTISGDMRLIADILMINKSAPKNDYRPTQGPKIKDLARSVLLLRKPPAG